MRINDLLELVQKLFYGNFDNILIQDSRIRETYELKDLTLSQIMKYDIMSIDGISIIDNKIYIMF